MKYASVFKLFKIGFYELSWSLQTENRRRDFIILLEFLLAEPEQGQFSLRWISSS